MNIELNVKDLKAALTCAAKKDIRYYLQGVCLEVFNDKEAAIISSDGSIMFICNIEIDNNDSDFYGQIIIPSKTIELLLKSIPKTLTKVNLKNAIGSKKWQIMNISFIPLDNKYPDYKRVIPAAFDESIGDYDIELLTRISKAMQIYTGMKAVPKLKQNGFNAAVMKSGEGLGIITPKKTDDYSYNGFNVAVSHDIKTALNQAD